VIADRFYDSTTAYQGSGRGLQDADWLEAFHARVTGGLEPARTFVMDVPIDVAFRRRTSRDDDRIEAGGANFFERVRTGYLALAARNPARVRVLDATRTPDELHREILAIVLAL
jgi:dTMP kinase